MNLEKKLVQQLLQTKQIYIFGANSRAKTLKGYIDFLYPEITIELFLVDDMEGNAIDIEGIPVCVLEEKTNLHNAFPVLIATKGIYHDEIEKRLAQKGMNAIVPLTVQLDNFLRNEYVKKYFHNQGKIFKKIGQLNYFDTKNNVEEYENVRVYEAKSIYDKPLKSEVYIESYIEPIQVGTALTEQRISANILTDNSGENISEKNRQYSELTAIYWIWKHAKENVVGLCHYRRHFILTKDWKKEMEQNHIDVILPVPTCIFPNIQKNYRERHDASDWDYMMNYLKINNPSDFEKANRVFERNLYSPCNMFIMKREILNELCSWMFPILFAVEKNGGVKAGVYQNRYLGFISEYLITLFFEIKQSDYNIAYADKSFYN